MSVEKITENIFANVDYEGGNVACINTTDGVVLVDTPTLRKDIEDWKAFVLDLNPKGIRYIINTHIHFDHVIGGHTADSITVYVVEDQILITGDNLTAARHPYKGEACFADWIKALQEMKTYDIKTIIPGHGEVCKKDEIDRFIEYFQTLWNKTNELVVKDYSSEDVVKTIQKEMFEFFEVEPEMLEGSKMMFDIGTRQLYEEIKSDRL